MLVSFCCLLSWDPFGHQELFPPYRKFLIRLPKFHLVSASKQTDWWRQGDNCLQPWTEPDLQLQHNIAMPAVKSHWFVNVEWEQCSVKAAYKTGECWLQTALAHKQFILLYLSFASFIHPVVLLTKFMPRYHHPLSYALTWWHSLLKNKVTLTVTHSHIGFIFRCTHIEVFLVVIFN